MLCSVLLHDLHLSLVYPIIPARSALPIEIWGRCSGSLDSLSLKCRVEGGEWRMEN